MKKTSYYIIGIIVLGVLLTTIWAYQRYVKVEEPGLLFFNVEKGGIEETIRARGGVVAEKDFALEFPFSGIIQTVYVQEGQEVNQGAFLMKLETIDFALDIQRLEALRTQKQANLDKLVAGATLEDIQVLETTEASAQTALDDAEINLENVRNKADADLQEDYDSALTTLQQAATVGKAALLTLSDIQYTHFSGTSQNALQIAAAKDAAVYTLLGAQNGGRWTTEIINALNGGAFGTVQATITDPTHENIDHALIEMEAALQKVKTALNAVPITTELSSTEKTSLNTEKNNIDSEIITLSSKKHAVQVQKATNQDNIADAETSVNTKKAALDLAESKLALKQAGARTEDIEIARAQIQETENQIAAVREKIRKSSLYAPVPARVVKIWLEARELFRPGQTAISLATSGHKIQADISELDIGKIREVDGNRVRIQLDAFPEQEFEGQVVSVEPQEIIKEGDKYYRINIYFEEGEATVRSGMSADLVIIISSKEDVLKIPELAIYEKEEKEFVKILEDGKEKEVEIETGISDGENIEIISGLSHGQTIVVSAD